MRKIISVPVLLLVVGGYCFSQNVGIGTITPAEKLHVVGNIKADTAKPNAIKLTTNAGIGKVLTSDALGNANWQNSIAASGDNVGYGVWGDCATNGTISEYNPVSDTTSAPNDNFGFSVSISGNYAIVGAWQDDVGINTDQGSASIYGFNGSKWILMQKLTDATGGAGDFFGFSVSISGNYAIVGSPQDDVAANTDQGSVSIYQFNGSSWVLMQKITDATGAAGDIYGVGVSISGIYTIVGAYTDDAGAGIDQGSASIYRFNGSTWVLMQKILDATGSAGDNFGYSVSISGNVVIIGANLDDAPIVDQGSASIYQYNGINWVLMQKIVDADGAMTDYFGFRVSISGNYAIVGSHLDDVDAKSNQGSASIFWYNGSNWVLMQKITDVNGAAGDVFGYSVSISGIYAIIGAPNDDVNGGTNQGSSSIYIRVGIGWQKLQYVTDPGGNIDDSFGVFNVIDAGTQRFVVGAYRYANDSGKAIFGKVQ